MPIYVLYWLIKGIFNPTYREGLRQRFGIGFPNCGKGAIWLHAVSVGEVQASVPLVHILLSNFPDRNILITTVTPTGAHRVKELFSDRVLHGYIPFETPYAVKNFFNTVNPCLALIMETEIWPEIFHTCGKREIPLVLVNARISPKSLKNYKRLLPLFREALSNGILIAAQSEADAQRFLELGANPERTWVTGNIKFDVDLPSNLVLQGKKFHDENFSDRPVWIAASTHHGEEELILDAHRMILKKINNAMLILVPRHPDRFFLVKSILERRKFKFISRSMNEECMGTTEVFLGDTMGELPLFYASSDVAFVGGSLVSIGCHNILEPASLGVPVITGSYLFNTQDIADSFITDGALKIVTNKQNLTEIVLDLFHNKTEALIMGEKGKKIIQNNKGAIDRLIKLLDPFINRINNH